LVLLLGVAATLDVVPVEQREDILQPLLRPPDAISARQRSAVFTHLAQTNCKVTPTRRTLATSFISMYRVSSTSTSLISDQNRHAVRHSFMNTCGVVHACAQ